MQLSSIYIENVFEKPNKMLRNLQAKNRILLYFPFLGKLTSNPPSGLFHSFSLTFDNTTKIADEWKICLKAEYENWNIWRILKWKLGEKEKIWVGKKTMEWKKNGRKSSKIPSQICQMRGKKQCWNWLMECFFFIYTEQRLKFEWNSQMKWINPSRYPPSNSSFYSKLNSK